ncbi:MAG TPA: HAD family hydrolase [Anaerolinea sp.]|nr:HAD family hydrolase [Anaerolinea sp.]
MTLQALIFDFDGVIIDTETPEYEIWQTILARFEVDLPLEDWERGIGSSLDAFDPVVFLEQRLEKKVDRQSLKEEHRGLLLADLAGRPPLPGVLETLIAAKQTGLLVGLASSSGIDWVRGNLERLGLLAYFDVLCTSEDVGQVKPDPALYRLALERLGISGNQAVAFEDSPNGIRAARAAGIYVVAIPTPVSIRLDLSQANQVVPSLDRLPLSTLMATMMAQAI